jgi:hypothetical protein
MEAGGGVTKLEEIMLCIIVRMESVVMKLEEIMLYIY